MRSVDAFGVQAEVVRNRCAQDVESDRVVAGLVQSDVGAGIELGQIACFHTAIFRVSDVAKERIACAHINGIAISRGHRTSQRVGLDFDFIAIRHRRGTNVRE